MTKPRVFIVAEPRRYDHQTQRWQKKFDFRPAAVYGEPEDIEESESSSEEEYQDLDNKIDQIDKKSQQY